MKIKPLADRVLVKNTKPETKTSSGIIIPEVAQETYDAIIKAANKNAPAKKRFFPLQIVFIVLQWDYQQNI